MTEYEEDITGDLIEKSHKCKFLHRENYLFPKCLCGKILVPHGWNNNKKKIIKHESIFSKIYNYLFKKS